MNRTPRWLTPVIIIAVILGSSILAVIWPSITAGTAQLLSGSDGPSVELEPSGPEVVSLDVDGYLLGEELIKVPALQEINDTQLTSLQIFGILLGAVIGGLVLLTVPIAAFVLVGSRQMTTLADDKDYNANLSALNQKQTDYVKTKKQEQPPSGKGLPIMPRWTAFSTGLMFTIVAYFLGYVVGAGISTNAASVWGNLFALIAIVLSLIYIRPQGIIRSDESSYGSVPWNMIFVVLSGAIMMGLGVGIMFAVISGTDPFPFLIWDPAPAIDWEWFGEFFAPLFT